MHVSADAVAWLLTGYLLSSSVWTPILALAAAACSALCTAEGDAETPVIARSMPVGPGATLSISGVTVEGGESAGRQARPLEPALDAGT